jgi:molybdopterin biosynthesis enzyme
MDVVVRRPVIDIIFNSPGATRAVDQLMGIVSNAIRGSGSEVGCIQFTAGDRALLADALLTSSADVVTVVGGTGSGPGDTTLKALGDVGEVVFHGVRMAPGGTVGFGMVGGKAVFASPGGMADIIAVNIVLTPSFARQAFGRPPLSAPAMRAPLSAGLPAAKHESRLVFAHCAGGSITPFLDEALTPAVLARANTSIFIPEGSRHRRRGELVEFRRLGVTM